MLALILTFVLALTPSGDGWAHSDARSSLASDGSASLPSPSDTSETATWRAGVRYGYDHVSEDRTAWRDLTATVQRSNGGTTWVLQMNRDDHFGTVDTGGKLDLWQDLWTGAYAHVQGGLAPEADVMAQQTVGVELFQGWSGWELSARYRWRAYQNESVHFVGVELANYIGNWYLRARAGAVPRDGSTSAVYRLAARRYLGSSSSYLDAQGGFGQTVAIVGPGILAEGSVYFGAIQWQQRLGADVGFTVGAHYSDDHFYQRGGMSVGVVTWW